MCASLFCVKDGLSICAPALAALDPEKKEGLEKQTSGARPGVSGRLLLESALLDVGLAAGAGRDRPADKTRKDHHRQHIG